MVNYVNQFLSKLKEKTNINMPLRQNCYDVKTNSDHNDPSLYDNDKSYVSLKLTYKHLNEINID